MFKINHLGFGKPLPPGGGVGVGQLMMSNKFLNRTTRQNKLNTIFRI